MIRILSLLPKLVFHMKLRITLILYIVFFTGLISDAQELPDILKKGNEIYFTFQVKALSEINMLTNLISIDNVRDKTVWAYANTPQYLKFLKLGYDITLLPSPGDGPGIEMTNHIVLSPLTTWNYYPTYTAYESLMAQFQSMYPAICNLDTITMLASGRRLLVLKISDNVNSNEAEPEFLYSSSIHGDETTGYILMLHLADYLLSNYGTNPEATELINNVELYICPLANPDGTYYGGNNSVSGARRYNMNGVDLNRNYPDPQNGQHPDNLAWQPETVAFMDFATQHHFVAGANFHGGAEVVNYPWDTWPTLHPDDNWCQFISREYADTVHLHAPSTYMDDLYNGVTNGYAWYEVNGGRQDYMNYYHHCREITIEISNIKLLPAAQLLTLWDYNWRSLIQWIKEARYGIHGVITDQVTGLPVAAKVFINGHDNNNSEVYSTANVGDYHRLLKAGTYTLEITAPCYQTQTITGVVVSDHATFTLNIQLIPGAGVTTSPVTAITSTGATTGGNVNCEGVSPVTARGVCWSTVANPLATGSHTTNGSGPGVFTSFITGLLASTAYHVRAYASNASGTVYGDDIQFTTTCGTVTTFPWNEGFENGGLIPGCWSQEQVNNSGLNWTFVTGNGAGNPLTAHGGTKNACLKDNTTGDNKTRLITPPLNLTSVPAPQLKFWHTQAFYSPDQDQLIIFYKTSAGGTWTQLVSYTASITAWTLETILLPNPSGEYYIAFEGNAKYGYGVCIDDVQVSTSCTTFLPVSVTIAASANPVNAGATVTFTASTVNGGTVPSYQWKVNGANLGANNPSFSYVPVNNDAITCTLTSNEICATGNPAVSNQVTMVVTSIPANLVLQNQAVLNTQCFNAVQTITVAGNGTSFIVLNGGNATMIAGQNILYLPGTTIDSGGYLYGYISTNGQYCTNQLPSMVSVFTGEGEIPDVAGQSFFKVYPNPASGAFSLELTGPDLAGKTRVVMYGMQGEKVLSAELTGDRKHRFPLPGYPSGIYLIQVITENKSGTARIIIK
jgi:hypothetical protein